MRFQPRPRLVDWSLLIALIITFATGLLSLFAGTPNARWVFVLHSITGLLVGVLLAWKLRRVFRRILRPAAWDPSTAVSVLAIAATIATLASGALWTFGGDITVVLGTLQWNALNLHILFALLLVPLVIMHLRNRLIPPTRGDIEGRRTVIQYAVLIGGGVLAWKLQAAIRAMLTAPANQRRFTGSRENGHEPGNTFPATSWVVDSPEPIPVSGWQLTVGGAVTAPQTFVYRDLTDPADRQRVTLDCTSGWYTTQEWRGIRVERLLAEAGPTAEAQWVSFKSITGYRWSLPLEEASTALLATHVGGERLTHGHGFPVRLVAPGRRGFQWVKWIEEIEVRSTPDYGQWLAIFTSGFT